MVRELYGAAACMDCTASMIATSGELLPEARATAAKLGVEVRMIAAPSPVTEPALAAELPLSFSAIWNGLIAPLAGRTVAGTGGKSNAIVAVDDGRLVRRISSGGKQSLPAELFRWTIERLLAGEVVTRKEINDHFVGRGSSGVVRILASLEPFEQITVEGLMALRLAPARSV